MYCLVVLVVLFLQQLLPLRSAALVIVDRHTGSSGGGGGGAICGSNHKKRLWFSKHHICNQSFRTIVRRKMTLSSQQEQQGRPAASSSQLQHQPDDETTAVTTTFRVLALHGSEGTAAEFTLDHWKTSMMMLLQQEERTIKWQVTSLQAPFPKGSGYAWWKLAPNERSFTADRYEGFETSAKLVQDAMSSSSSSSSFDVLVGHSQGAILLTALLALGRLDTTATATDTDTDPRPQRIILNGVAWPNPFGQQLLQAAASNRSSVSSSSSSSSSKAPPIEQQQQKHDILLIIGKKDRINPPEQARRVQHALEQAGHVVQVLEHGGGHSLPQDAASMQAIEQWLFSSKIK